MIEACNFTESLMQRFLTPLLTAIYSAAAELVKKAMFFNSDILAVSVKSPQNDGDLVCSYIEQALSLNNSSTLDGLTSACFNALVNIPEHTSVLNEPVKPLSNQKIIEEYMDYKAYLINSALRENDKEAISKYSKFIKKLNLALSHSQDYEGLVFRGSVYPPVKDVKPYPGYTAVYLEEIEEIK